VSGLTRRGLTALGGGAALQTLLAGGVRAGAGPRPDILLLVLDDAGYSDLGCFGSEIRTPHIDALAAGGLRYNRFDTRAQCSPTRAALLTGRNNHTVRMAELPSRLKAPNPADNSKTKGELPANVETVAEALRTAGYATSAVGKWHLSPAYEGGPDERGPGSGIDPGGPKASWPLQRGFDRYYGFLGGWTSHWAPSLVEDNRMVPTPTRPGYHLTEDLVDRAIAWSPAKTAEKPSFMYLAFGAPHSPLHPPRAYLDRYADRYVAGWDRLRDERFRRMRRLGVIPASAALSERAPEDATWDSLTDEQRRIYARYMAAYAGFLEHTDAQIGRLIAHLKATARFDNTLILLTSDNGAAAEGGATGGFRKPYGDTTPPAEIAAHLDELGAAATMPLYQRAWARAGVTPFRGHKATLYAGGLRTPLIVSWPRGIAARGAVRDQNVDVIDIAPTLLDVAGARFATTRDGAPLIPVAGASVRGTFTSAQARTRQTQFFEFRGARAIRVGPWKAIATHKPGTPFESDRWELFDTATDFSEVRDVAAQHPDRLKALQDAWWTEARRYADPPLAEFVPPHLQGRP